MNTLRELLIREIRDGVEERGSSLIYGERLELLVGHHDASEERTLSIIQFAQSQQWHVDMRDDATLALFTPLSPHRKSEA